MPHFDIIRAAQPGESFRVKSVMGTYDLQTNKTTEHFVGDIDLPDEWNVGLIVGRSGTGKTTIARELFGDCIIDGYEYTHESILDDMPKDASVAEITAALSSVGFASPPSWLKSYAMLSNGEKMRCDLARAMLEKRDVFCFDEFTSVVDRTVAKVGSFAIQKAIRRGGQKFIAVTCHADVEEWLMPDWVFNTDTMTFSVKNLAEQKKNRPGIRLDIFETKLKGQYWEVFRKYHYLSHNFNVASRVWICYADGNLAGFASAMQRPSTVKHLYGFHRVVVFPDYQGIGIGKKLMEVVAQILTDEGKKVSLVTSNAALIYGMKKSARFKLVRVGRIIASKTARYSKEFNNKASIERITATFNYIPQTDKELVRDGGRS